MGKLKDFYVSYISDWITGGELNGMKSLSDIDIKPLFDRIVTRRSLKKVICVSKIPYNYEYSLTGVLNKIVFDIDPESKVFINTYSIPAEANVHSDQFKRQMSKLEDTYKKYETVFDSLNQTDQIIGKKVKLNPVSNVFITSSHLQHIKEEFESYSYVYNQVTSGESLTFSFLFVEIVSRTSKNLKKCSDEVVAYLRNNKFDYKPLTSTSSKYLSNFSPASVNDNFPDKDFNENLFSAENMTHLVPYNSNGFIGNGKGQLLGVNMKSKTPFIYNYFESGSSQISVVLGPSGTGKTYFGQSSMISFCADDIHCSVIDVKGNEYTKLKKIIGNTTVVDISEASDMFVNTLRLDDINITDATEAKEFYDISLTATMGLCKILIGETGDASTTESILRTCISKVFSSNDVICGFPNTYHNSKRLKYSMIVEVLESLKTSPSFGVKRDLIELIILRLDNHFRGSNLFKGKEVSLKDIMESTLVVYALNKNSDQSQTLADSVRAFCVSYLDMKKIAYRKSKGLATVCYYEELQRKQEFMDLITFISAIVTGARSNNVAVFIFCNTIATLMEKDMYPISSNINNYVVAPLKQDEDYEMLGKLGCKDMIKQLRFMRDNIEKFRNTFLIKYDSGVHRGITTLKTILPSKYQELFKTRDTIE